MFLRTSESEHWWLEIAAIAVEMAGMTTSGLSTGACHILRAAILISVLMVVGKKESAERLVSIRRLGSEGQKVMGLDDALKMLAEEATPPDIKRERQVVA